MLEWLVIGPGEAGSFLEGLGCIRSLGHISDQTASPYF